MLVTDHGGSSKSTSTLAAEFAVLIARSPSGFTATYPPIGTLQVEGICRELTIPADLPEELVRQGASWARSILEGFGATGIAAVEYFVTRDGRLLLNEFALRPHNSGHITLESCATSQFHQHLRAVLDWPLGETGLLRPAATVNLIADASTTEFSEPPPAGIGGSRRPRPPVSEGPTTRSQGGARHRAGRFGA